jgi:hypothetical protein
MRFDGVKSLRRSFARVYMQHATVQVNSRRTRPSHRDNSVEAQVIQVSSFTVNWQRVTDRMRAYRFDEVPVSR